MITKLDIENLGCFQDFRWNQSIRNEEEVVVEFARLNIIYGRNYSGKTTLSRVFASFHNKELPEKYEQPAFKVYSAGEEYSQDQLEESDFQVRVYNKDFQNNKLSFLSNPDEGEVASFAILGETNVALQKEIEELSEILEGKEDKSGLRQQYLDLEALLLSRESDLKTHVDSLDDDLKNHANQNIKRNSLYGFPTYNITWIKKDVEAIRSLKLARLTDPEKKANESLIKEDEKPEVKSNLRFNQSTEVLLEKTKSLLSLEIRPTAPIQELINDHLLQDWVKRGIPLHRDERETCGFCGQKLPPEIWDKLDAHFNEVALELEAQIDRQLEALSSALSEVSSIQLPENSGFYSLFQPDIKVANLELMEALDKYRDQLRALVSVLKTRKENLFDVLQTGQLELSAISVHGRISAVDSICDSNNAMSATLEQKKTNARERLRLDDVLGFLSEIEYDSKVATIEAAERARTEIETDKARVAREIDGIEDRLAQIRATLIDEKKGAEQVNEYLCNYFGHEQLRLDAVRTEEDTQYVFQVKRGQNVAANLSDGECSLISFCYFMARLKDTDSQGKSLIVYIDDPISSLDYNHIYFVFSLIQTELAQQLPANEEFTTCCQLFVSTHNLDFLKYLKRLRFGNKTKNKCRYFLVERGALCSSVSLMPEYLSRYTTEFNFLFHEIYKCRKTENSTVYPDSFYNFGNNMRKFLEAFLFFKYPYLPDQSKPLEKLYRFFGDDAAAAELANRIDNELSHLGEIFERGMRPVEVPEISKLSSFVLAKLKEKDIEQYESLLASIGQQKDTA